MKFYTNVTVHRGKIIHSGYDNGKKFVKKENFQPTLAIECNEDFGYRTLMGKNAKQIEFDSISEFNSYKKDYKDVLNLHGNISANYQFISEKYKGEINFNKSDIRTIFYDIETIDETKEFKGFPKPEDAPIPIVSIALKDLKTNTIWLFSLKDYDVEHKKNKLDCKKVIHRKCNSEYNLLLTFVKFIEKIQPDLLIGYNNSKFDDPYVLSRIEKICGLGILKKLSPIGVVEYEFKENNKGDMNYRYHIKGLQVLDYLDLYKKFVPAGRESYSLSFISEYELGEDKVDYSDHDNITDFYIEDPIEFQFYNIYDVELLYLLDEKLKLLDLVYTVAYMAKINYEDIMSPIRTWDSILFEELKEKNIVIPPDKFEHRVNYAGAYVHKPIPGIYDWVVSYDLASLYPHIIMQFNISPETLVNKTEDVNQDEIDERFLNSEISANENYVLTGSGQYFSKDVEGIFPFLMEKYYNSRNKVKSEMKDTKNKRDENLENKIAALDIKQLALKILLNSAYGAMGSPYFRYFDVRLAKAITLSGQLAIKYISKKLNEYTRNEYKLDKNLLIYTDTDSVYLDFDFVARKLKTDDPKKIVDSLVKFSDKYIEPKINKIYKNLANYLNCNKNRMLMEREKISEKFLIVSKKRYAALVWDDEGYRYDEAELKVTGLEIVRSSTPNKIKSYLKESIIHLMRDPENIDDYVNGVKKEFFEMSPEDIAFPRSVTDVKKYTDPNGNPRKGCPIGVRAALVYNKYITDNKIEMDRIADGDKIKFFYSLTPNPFYNQNVFGYINKMPNREEIIKYLDYPTQFEKVFLSIIRDTSKKVGFELETKKQTNLEEMF